MICIDHHFVLIGLRLCAFTEGAALCLARVLHPSMFAHLLPFEDL